MTNSRPPQMIRMLEDLEPFPDRPHVGDVFAPTTYWVDATAGIVRDHDAPNGPYSHIPATIRRSDDAGDQVEWVADLGGGFTTMLHGDHTSGPTVLHGCLMWDRYLWLDFATEPVGTVRLVARAGHIVQRRRLTPTRHPGWFDMHYLGHPFYDLGEKIPDGHDCRYNVLEVTTERTR